MYNILVVDDATFMRNIIKKILHEHRYKVVAEAATGREAVVQYKAFKPNLVLMDITMPDQTGTDAVKEILEYDSAAKVVMCSAMGLKAMVIQAIANGAKGFIVKPFDKNMVIETVANLIGVPPQDAEQPEAVEGSEEAPAPSDQASENQGEDNESSKDMSSLERRLRHQLKV